MDGNTTLCVEDFVYFSGSGLSAVCVIVLLITWCLLPQWRTLQNFISLNHIITGTLYLIFLTLIPFVSFTDTMYGIIHYCLVTSICWSLLSSLLAYFRLVLIYVGQISLQKRKAIVFVYGTGGVILSVFDLVLHFIGVGTDENIILLFPVYFIMTINLIIFIRIVLSVMACCHKPMSVRNSRHVLSLVAVAFICDSMLIALVIGLFFLNITIKEYSLSYPIVFILTHRLLFETVFVLLTKSTRTHCKLFCRKKINRIV